MPTKPKKEEKLDKEKKPTSFEKSRRRGSNQLANEEIKVHRAW